MAERLAYRRRAFRDGYGRFGFVPFGPGETTGGTGLTVVAVPIAVPVTLPAPTVTIGAGAVTVAAVPIAVPVTLPAPTVTLGPIIISAPPIAVPVTLPVPGIHVGAGMFVDAVPIVVGVAMPAPAVHISVVVQAPPIAVAVAMPAPVITIAGVVPPPPPVTIAIEGVSSPLIPFESLSIVEALAFPGPQPTTASFTIVDKARAITVQKLADVVIGDGSETLFRGQVVRVRRKPTSNYRRIEVDCVSYDRFAAGSPVGQPVGGGATYQPADGTTVTLEYDSQASSAYLGGMPVPDKLLFAHMVDRYWRGPDTDVSAHVAYTTSIPGDYWWSDTTLDVVFSDLCALVGSAWIWFLRPDLAWHFGPVTAYRAPADFSDTPDHVHTFPTHELSADEDMIQIVGAAYVRGGVAAGSGWINPNPYLDPDVGYAPATVISATSRNAAERSLYARPELSRRGTSLETLSFYTLGTSGWHRGQTVRITNAALELDAAEYVIRTVTLTMLDPHSERRYDLEVGDQRSLSLAYEVRAQRRAGTVPTVDYGKLKDPGTRWTLLPLYDTAPAPGDQQSIAAQLTTSAGDPLRLANVKVHWHLWRNGVALTSNDGAGDPGGADGSYLATAVSETDFTGRAYNQWYVHADATPGDVFDVIPLGD